MSAGSNGKSQKQPDGHETDKVILFPQSAICMNKHKITRNVVTGDFFTFFYAGDNLDLPEWDKRSLSGDVKLDEKSRIAILALELAYKISE